MEMTLSRSIRLASNAQLFGIGGPLVGIDDGLHDGRLWRSERGFDRGADVLGSLAVETVGAAGAREGYKIDRVEVAAVRGIAKLKLFELDLCKAVIFEDNN